MYEDYIFMILMWIYITSYLIFSSAFSTYGPPGSPCKATQTDGDWNSPRVTSCPYLRSPCTLAHFVTFLMAILETIYLLGHAEIPSATRIRWDTLYWEWLEIQHKLVKKWKGIIGSINWKDQKQESLQIQLDFTIFLLRHLYKHGPQAPGSPVTVAKWWKQF